MDLEINHKIKISDLLEKLTTTQQIEVVKYLLDYDKVKEVIETEIIKNSIEVDDLNDEIESLESEIKTLQNKEDKYKFSILIFPNELTTIQKFKENNYLDFKYKIDYTYYSKYFIDCEFSTTETIINFSKSVNFQYTENKPSKLKRIKDSQFKNY